MTRRPSRSPLLRAVSWALILALLLTVSPAPLAASHERPASQEDPTLAPTRDRHEAAWLYMHGVGVVNKARRVVCFVAWEALYPIEDSLYRLTGDTVSGNTINYTKTFTYDPVGNRQTQVTSGQLAGNQSYSYDTRDRLLTDSLASYSYDLNGNLVTKSGEATYTWDFENRLLKVQKVDGTLIQHVYDVDGNRVQTTTTLPAGVPQVVNYLVDTSGGLSQVVAESNGAGQVTAYYLRGDDDLLAVIRGTGTRFYHADGLGSIRALTNETGQVTDTYQYSAFGELLSHVGPDQQPYAFAGEPLDPNSGLYYNRARWLDPRLGRFVGMDTFAGRLADPSTLHRYVYAEGDPSDKTDPSGMDPDLMTLNLAFDMMSAVNSTAIPNPKAAYFLVAGRSGPEVKSNLRDVIRQIEYDYTHWTYAQKKHARNTVMGYYGLAAAANAWDIAQLFNTGWMFSELPPDCRPSVGCGQTVAVDGRVFTSGDVNYVMWGTMNRLMATTFGNTWLETEAYALGWKWWTNKPITPDLIPWTRAGYDGWPSVPTPPAAGPQSWCGASKVRTTKAFTYTWAPNVYAY